ncbi:MAG: carboxylating nicotinate-nucleotide diphosphorylase [Caldimicrobium sp.]|nr:carboxylating nicotinate-nucleotide diphosphorylase [Caldimicrobium sp.]MCX7874227.1 carboxylating nicotinate-nucleotide diphosphorylase [Caldimicrobium sp.]MDW8094631.1 carboxylating nicotinate-nucleotide diphosphorylase [Caldimicrobium sp.]
MQLENWQIRKIVLRALEEDLPFGDRTSSLLIPPSLRGKAFFLAKENLVICGEFVAEMVFKEIDPEIEIEWLFPEGTEVPAKTKFGFVRGRVVSLLKGERVALNFLQHLSGIATKVRKMCSALINTQTLLLDTRKTIPGLKVLQKYAVKVGGGANHRFSLSDGILIKDNHIKALGGLGKVLEKLSKIPDMLKVELEVKNLEELDLLLNSDSRVDRVLLDNFTPEEVKIALQKIKEKKPLLEVEVSGGITEENLEVFASLGVDYISSGALTHSVKAVDISFKIEETWE